MQRGAGDRRDDGRNNSCKVILLPVSAIGSWSAARARAPAARSLDTCGAAAVHPRTWGGMGGPKRMGSAAQAAQQRTAAAAAAGRLTTEVQLP